MNEPITNNVTIPSDCRLLPIQMPPMLPDVVGVKSEARYFSLSYEGGKAWWSDRRAGATFSYYGAYEPYVSHLTMAIHLLDVDLGSDDGPPTHALLIDRGEGIVYVGGYDEVSCLLEQQHPPRCPPTPEEIEEMNRDLAKMEKMSLDEMREIGMFEFMLGSTPQQQDRCGEMIAWLDQFINEELIQSYVAASEAGQFEAFYHLDRFRQRVEFSQSINTTSRLTH
ncbi:MAG: hypothetical protein ACRD2L_26340 [Terriglobia bacterium]